MKLRALAHRNGTDYYYYYYNSECNAPFQSMNGGIRVILCALFASSSVPPSVLENMSPLCLSVCLSADSSRLILSLTLFKSAVEQDTRINFNQVRLGSNFHAMPCHAECTLKTSNAWETKCAILISFWRESVRYALSRCSCKMVKSGENKIMTEIIHILFFSLLAASS